MKLRIRSDSLRLRLGPGEVQRLLRDHQLVETTRFGPGDDQQLHYRLVLGANDAPIAATLDGAGITVTIGKSAAQVWATGNELGLSAKQPTGDGHVLRLLIEKDLECIDGPPEPNQDVYPNPAAKCEPAPAAGLL